MNFTELYGGKIFGSIRGFDRIRFRGTIRWIANERGIQRFAGMQNILLKHFKSWAQSKTDFVRSCCARRAKELKIPMRYLESGGVDKEALAGDCRQRGRPGRRVDLHVQRGGTLLGPFGIRQPGIEGIGTSHALTPLRLDLPLLG